MPGISLIVVQAVLLISLLLAGCAPPRPAPVVSREAGYQPSYVSKPGYYKVRTGDTIYSIAWRYGLDHRQFAKWNGIRPPYRIYPGRTLRVKPRASRVTARSKPTITKPARESKPQIAKLARAKTTPKKKSPSRKNFPKNLKLRWQWPTKGKIRTKFKRGDQSRKGVVLAGRLGQEVKAAEAGTVVYSGSGLIGYGQLLIIKHNKNFLSAYGHNKKLLVKEGDKVKKGTRIAEMGTNGSGKVVLHFEIRRNGVPINPLPLLPRRS